MALFDAKKTPVTASEMYESLRSSWLGLWAEDPSHETLCVLLAQWALETARGKAMVCYNIGGIKATGEQDHCYFTTLEVLPRAVAEKYLAKSTAAEPCEIASDSGGTHIKMRFKPNHPVCRFRAYATLGESCVGYLQLLKRRFALAWPFVASGQPRKFVMMLKKQGYFTADEAEYAVAVVALFNEFLKLPRKSQERDTTPDDETTVVNPDEFPKVPVTFHIEGLFDPEE